MKVKQKKINELKPYEFNTKIHTEDQVSVIANSIEKFGFRQPIVIDKEGCVIVGHGRLQAAKKLGLKEVPCVIADDLTEDEVRAYRIADNKANESEWDFKALEKELGEISMDMSDFGMDGIDLYNDEEEDDFAGMTQRRVANILNLEKVQYEGVGKYEVPALKPVYNLPKIKKWIGFNEVLSDKNPEGKAVHFFIDDYQFIRTWNSPEKYIDKLRQYVCVASPDFSTYGDMPMALQIFNHYRKQWVGKYFQDMGIIVIPTVRCSTNPKSLEWYLDGIPKGGIVIMSSMWTVREHIKDITYKEYTTMKEVLKPKKIFIYGKDYGNMGISEDDPVEYIDTFTWRFDDAEGQ